MSQLEDGHSTIISFTSLASGETILFYVKEVTPPGISGGGPIDVTTMLNTALRTNAPKQLKTATAASFVAAYDPAVYDQILAMINVNQEITVTFPDLSTLVFWGWLDEFTLGALVEGEQPTADGTIEPSNRNGSGVETAPVYAAA